MGFGTYVCYSLPRMISPAIQCSFLTYFFEMYTTEFGWSMAEYGTVQTLYSRTQILSFFIFGFIFAFAFANAGIGGAMSIEVFGTIMHWITYFLLIFLPIKWHGVKTPFVNSLFEKGSNFELTMFIGPITISNLIHNKYRLFITYMLYWPLRWCWTALYPFMWIFYACIVNRTKILNIVNLFLRSCCVSKKKVVNITQIPGTVVYEGDIPDLGAFIDAGILPVLETLESIPPPTCSACCNTTCCNGILQRVRSWRRFTKTRTFSIYFLVVANGVGMSMHELSNKALESYVGIGSINTNLTFFFTSNIVIYTIFSFVKLYVHSKAAFAETFYLLAIVFLALQIPILPIFGFGTKGDYTPDGIDATWPSYVCLVFKWLSTTVFHSTVVFLIFSGGPLIFYVSIFILGGHTVLMSFGNLVLFGSLNMTSFFFMILAIANATKENPFDPIQQMAISGACIVGQLLTFFILYPHDWRWNKGNWVNYILLIVTGFVNSKFVTYANIMLGASVTGDARVRKYAWIFNGAFYSGTNVVVSTAMPKMFNAFGQNEVRECGCGCYRISYNYCFPTVYKTITGVFILLNFIALGIFGLVWWIDRAVAAAAMLAGNALDLKNAAQAFYDAAGGNNADQKLQTFRAASAALQSAGQALNIFAITINPLLLKACKNGLKNKAGAFQTAAQGSGTTGFQGAAGQDNSSGFRKVAHTLYSSGNGNSNFNTAETNFGTAQSSFSTFATNLSTCGNLQTNAPHFKTAASNFATAAIAFNTAVQSSSDCALSGHFTTIKGEFNTGAGNGAAKYFYEAADGLYNQIKDNLWPWSKS